MRSPSRTPQPNQLLTFVVLGASSVVLWAITVYGWWQAYLWFRWVTEPTFLLTFFVIPVPFLAYRNFTGNSGLLTSTHHPPAPGTAVSPTAGAPGGRATNPFEDWLVWLGKGESHQGMLVVWIFVFWSILYWSLPSMTLTALSFSAWGLLTILGIVVIRLFFRSSREVSAPSDPKSRAK